LFKGTTNIFNALLVPLVLHLNIINQKWKEIFGIFGALFLVCFILFKVQIIFLLFYCAIALLLLLLRNKRIPTLLSVTVLTVALSLSFWIAIVITDYVFLTHMGDIMLRVFNGNYLVYMGMLFVEGALVGSCQIFVSRAFYKRLNSIIQ